MTLWFYSCRFVRAFSGYFVVLLMIAIGSACFEILTEYQIKEIIDRIASYEQVYLLWLIGLFVLYKFLNHFVFFLMRMANIYYDPKIIALTILDIYRQVFAQSLYWFDCHLSGEVSNKIADFQEGITTLIQSLFRIGIIIFTVILGIIFLCRINLYVAGVLGCFIVIYVPVIYWLLQKQMRLQRSFYDARQAAIGVLNDGIVNVFAIKTIGSVADELENRFQPALSVWQARDRARKWFDAFIVDNIDTLLIVLMSAVQMYLITMLFQSGQISAGGFAFVAILTLKIHEQLNTFLDTLLFSVNPCIAKIQSAFAFIFQSPDVQDKPDAKVLSDVRGAICYSHVNFTYPGRNDPVIKDFSLDICVGERIGLVGESGAGKTTIMKSLLRYFDIDQGCITIDGQSLQDVTQDSLRENISLIPQDITMLHRSIYENLILAKPGATRAQVEYACKHANIHEDIMQMSEQYNTIVGERGVKLSGGQRQRIAIARAILKNAPILILDEATSSLDTPTERLIQASIDEILDESRATVIAIAHRLSTLKHMDRIIVLDRGSIVEEGTHAGLIRKVGGHYKRLWDMQLL